MSGIVTTILVSLLISQYCTVLGAMKRNIEDLKVIWRLSRADKAMFGEDTTGGETRVKPDGQKKEDAVEEDEEDVEEMTAGNGVAVKLTSVKKPFEFRERLWHEPPELNHAHFEPYGMVQDEFKKEGGFGKKQRGYKLEWMATFLELYTEQKLRHRIGKRYN